jgi:hypothetical protein
MLNSRFAVTALLAMQIGTLSEAHAACRHDRMPWRFGETMASVWVTDDKSVCTSTHSHPENIAKIEFESKPQHGIAGKSGPYAVAYRPNAGFHGSDTFTYAVTSNSNAHRGAGRVARITVFVTVQ